MFQLTEHINVVGFRVSHTDRRLQEFLLHVCDLPLQVCYVEAFNITTITATSRQQHTTGTDSCVSYKHSRPVSRLTLE